MSSDQCSTSCCSKSESEQLHVAIIGSGSGAFACAIKAAENGARVTIIAVSYTHLTLPTSDLV